MRKWVPLVLLLFIIFNSVSAVIMDPSVDYVAGDFTLNSRTSIDVPYINLSSTWINLGNYGNITFVSNVSSNEALVEVGKGYTDGNAVYTTDLTMDVYAPADWTVSLNLDFNYLYMVNLTGNAWTNDLLFPKYIFDSHSVLTTDNTVETFLQQAGVWPNVDYVFRHNGGWDSWWIEDPINTVETIDNYIEHPEYDEYRLHVLGTADQVLQLVKPASSVNISNSGYYTQVNTTHRQYSYTLNPKNTLDIDTENYTNLTLTVDVNAYNDTLEYNGTHDIYHVTQIYEVGKPYGSDIIYAEYNTTWNSINMTWNPGNNSDTTVVVRNNNSWPTSPVDGYEVQNNSAVWYNESGVNTTRYYCLFGYNSTTNSYSPRTLVYWGALLLWNCYNESNPSQSINYSIEITNADATDVFVANNIGNNYAIDLLNIPYGDNTIFTINNNSYKQRVYYFDLAVCNFYNYSFYLPPIETPGSGGAGGEENITRQYRVQVIDDYGYAVEGAKVDIRRYINTTDEYTTMAILITDGYGEADVWLRPEVHYKVFITAEGYLQQTPIPDWFPDATFYGANYPKTFQIYIDVSNVTEYSFWDVIQFNGTMYDTNALQVEYNDLLTNTINAQFYTYEVYNNTVNLNSTNTTTSDSFSYWVMGINISRPHRIIVHLNHTNLGYVIQSIIINPLRTPEYNRGNIKSIITNVVGSFDLPWIELLFVFIPAICLLILLSKKRVPELGIIVAGLWICFLSVFLSLHETLIGSGVFLVFVGAIYGFVKGGKERI